MDRPKERELAALVRQAFNEAATSGHRGRDYFELAFDPDDVDFHRRWRVDSTGGFIFATQIQRAKTGPASAGKIHLLSVAVDIIRALGAAKILFDHLGVGGRCCGGVLLAFGEAPVVTTGHTGALTLSGIDSVAAKSSGTSGAELLDIDSSELSNPASIAAASLCTQLREQRHADVDLEALTAALESLARENGFLPKT